MKTVFVGAGQGCRAVLELVVQGRLTTLSLQILGVVDVDPDAPGIAFARAHSWPTFQDLELALRLPGLELVIELTGSDDVRDKIYRSVPQSVRVMDHSLARVFWDLDEVVQHLREQLQIKTRLEAESRAERRRLQQILDTLPDAVMVVDEHQCIERVNRRFETVTGIPAASVLGRPCREVLCHKSAMEQCHDPHCPRNAVLASGRPVTVVAQQSCLTQGNSRREAYYEITANPIPDQHGQASMVVTSREVTEQVLLKRETEESARRFEQILSTVHGLITIKDVSGRYQLINPAAATFFGLPAAAIIGQTAREILPPHVAEEIEAHDRQALAEARHISHEERLMLRGKRRVLVSERILLTDYRGKVIGLCCVSNDVTQARRLQRELLQSEKHAAVGKLAAGVAHELNNPLTGILTFVEDLLDGASEADAAFRDLQVILRETLRCRQIVRDLLDFSRQTEPDRQTTTLRTVIQRALDLVLNQASFQDIEFQVDFGAKRLQVAVDPNQLQQVVLNLVINARDAMNGKGRIAIRAEEPQRGVAMFEVRDTGTGIEEEHLSQIFEPFFSTKGEQGMGLGLSVVRGIVEQHGGTIEVTSRTGEGTTFRVALPSADTDTAEVPSIPSTVATGAASGTGDRA